MFDRIKAIHAITDDDIETIVYGHNGQSDGIEYLYNLLVSGMKGYDNFTDEELMQELEARDISYLFGDNDDEAA